VRQKWLPGRDPEKFPLCPQCKEMLGMLHLRRLLADRDEAAELSAGARRVAQERFAIDRFAAEWLEVLEAAAGRGRGR
jgi:hypothetical protein